MNFLGDNPPLDPIPGQRHAVSTHVVKAAPLVPRPSPWPKVKEWPHVSDVILRIGERVFETTLLRRQK
jgi:hypothetical protein